ncbi:SDR family NAD(P)-dependent oxidoreductase [Uliginosibacterium sediminicola]|uniref:SDR family NAD(P)-dependent oxidoreductase n=1 Tax=Uliginosibacterium sediminicola TaxID=2024550 RepID=A0ABU9YWT9_9RHOO
MSLNPPIRDWSGRRVWLVGASTGIGAALAQQLAQRGARLILSARNAPRLQAFADSVPGSVAVAFDVSVAEQWAAASAAARAAFGGIDVLILNAGTYTPMRAWELSRPAALAQVRATFETNLMGVYSGLAACLPEFLARGSGHLLIVASVAGYGGLPRALCYGPSKAALINLAESLYLDLAAKGIGVSIVNPGFVATPLTAQNDFAMPALMSAEAAAGRIVQGMAAGRFEIHFPRRFSWFLKCLQCLPRGLYFRIVGKVA